MSGAEGIQTQHAVDALAGFQPSPALRNRHLQSVAPSLPTRRPAVERRTRAVLAASQPLIVEAGEGVRLLAQQALQSARGREPGRDVAVLLHGWEGSAQSLYILSLAQYLFDRGFDVVRLNLRDHGDSQYLNEELFHSCRIREVVGAVCSLRQMHAHQRMSIAGFSLGGNFAVRVGAHARAAGLDLHRIVAVCPVLDPASTLEALEQGWALYRHYFIWKWRRSLRRKQAVWPGRYDFGDLLRLRTLTDMTEQLVLGYTEYPTLQDYLKGYAIVGGRLDALDTPTRIIAAADDPIIPARDLARLGKSLALSITQTAFGGHCGYYNGGKDSWLEREIGATLGV